jgi:hypothetical protein
VVNRRTTIWAKQRPNVSHISSITLPKILAHRFVLSSRGAS